MAAAMMAWVSWLLLAGSIYFVRADISNSCIQCLCHAVSGGPSCVFDNGCHDGVCGPYAITFPYWQDGGRPTVGLEDRQAVKTYENCALNPTCAEATIRGYMNKFHQDCNGDGVEDCLDYAAIHFHGGYGCNKPLSVPTSNVLNTCLSQLTPSVPETPVQPFPENPVQPFPENPVQPFPENPVQPFPENPVQPFPENPEQPFPEIPDDNDIAFPKQQTTFPPIDVRLG